MATGKNLAEKILAGARRLLGGEGLETAAKGVEERGPTDGKKLAQKKRALLRHNIFYIKSAEAPEKGGLKIVPSGIKEFDRLIKDGGFERGSTILVSGGAGTGKTTFILQSMHHSASEKGLKCAYISFEEEPEKIKAHMKKNYGWDFYELERKGLFTIVKLDSLEVARDVEQALLQRKGELKISMTKIDLPFLPDVVALDSLSALSIAFTEEESYRKYISELLGSLVQLNCVSYVISETEQDPRIYSRTGVEEFLVDGVVVLYNLKKGGKRENALEILKLRSSAHQKSRVPYRITTAGLVLDPNA